jgi:hypothetical protein
MMAIWFAAKWLIAVVMSALTAGPTWGVVPIVVVAAAVCVMVVTVSLLVSLSPSNMLYMFWVAYPFCPDVLRSAIAVRHHPVRLMKGGLEGCVHLGSQRFPLVKFLEGEDVGLEENADGVCNYLVIGIWKLSNASDFLTLLDVVEEYFGQVSGGH